MRFKLDENLPMEVADLLRVAGHAADTVGEERLGGARDPDVAALCLREGRALITLDLDFADIRSYPPARYPGLVVLRLDRQDKRHVLEACSDLADRLSSEPLSGRLWIVEASRIRIHGGEE